MSVTIANWTDLGERIDQLSSEARDFADYPEVAKTLDLAWWVVEDTLREETGIGSCGHHLKWQDLVRRDVKRDYCPTCAHYMEIYNKGRHLRGIL